MKATCYICVCLGFYNFDFVCPGQCSIAWW